MPSTTTDLFRRGNANSPRLTNVRIGKDLLTFYQDGVEFVLARSGGVSTFSAPGPGPNWWVLPASTSYPDEITIINDHGNHYNWEPSIDLPLTEFIALLASMEEFFVRT